MLNRKWSQHLLFPFRTAPLLLVVIFSILLAMANHAGLFGMPLALILLSWFFKYCCAFVDSIVNGEEEPPVLSVEMVNPVSEQRPLAMLMFVLLGVWAVQTLAVVAGGFVATFVAAVLLVCLPACISVLLITQSVLKALSPVRWFSVIRELGWDYVLICGGAIAVIAGELFFWIIDAPLVLSLAVSQWLLLLFFTLIGSAIHRHRLALGVMTRSASERRTEREQRDHERAREDMIDTAYAQLRSRKPLEAWKTIESWLTAHSEAWREEYPALIASAQTWDDKRIADRLVNGYLPLLLKVKSTGQALEVLEQHVKCNPSFRPAEPAIATRLAELASLGGKPALRRHLETLQQSE